jgi:hypothetical protein
MALNTEYDIEKAFRAIEDELIASMIRNLDRHIIYKNLSNKRKTLRTGIRTLIHNNCTNSPGLSHLSLSG